MTIELLHSSVLTILSAIVTGGFVLVFVEIGNRKNRENDRYEQLMRPFMKKLSSYFRFVQWCQTSILYPSLQNQTSIESEFKDLVDELGRYGRKSIMSGGGDYLVNYFSAEELHNLGYNKINHIWYLHDKMNPCRLSWDTCFKHNDRYIKKELAVINPEYLNETIDYDLFICVSSDFFIDIYQPIENDTYYHETYQGLFKKQSIFVSIALLIVLMMLCLMLCVSCPAWLLRLITILIVCLFAISLLILGVESKKQIMWCNRIVRWYKKKICGTK